MKLHEQGVPCRPFAARVANPRRTTVMGIPKTESICYDSTLVVICDDKIQQASDKAAARVGQAVFGYAVGKALEASGLSLLAMLI